MVRDYAKKKSSLIDEAKRRVGTEQKRVSTKRLAVPAKLAPVKPKSVKLKGSLWSRLPKRIKSALVTVGVVVVAAWVVYHIPFARIGQAITEKTHRLGASLHHAHPAQTTSVVAVTAAKSKVNESAVSTRPASVAPVVATSTVAATAAAPPAPPPPVEKPVFDFYTVLPSRNGDASHTSDSDTITRAAATTPTASAVVQSASAKTVAKPVVLQVATFSNGNDADKMRAQFLLAGMNPRISQSNGQYRVVFGPFATQQDADTMRAKINKANVSGVSVQTLVQ